jgi:hypothetical protein
MRQVRSQIASSSQATPSIIAEAQEPSWDDEEQDQDEDIAHKKGEQEIINHQ